MTDKEVMQQALDAMLNFPNDISDEMFESMKSLKARLAQPEPEPIAWLVITDGQIISAETTEPALPYGAGGSPFIPVYTAPPYQK